MTRWRADTGTCLHVAAASFAPATASSNSWGVHMGTCEMTSFVAGFVTGIHEEVVESWKEPLRKRGTLVTEDEDEDAEDDADDEKTRRIRRGGEE